jgi:hypothetical protein
MVEGRRGVDQGECWKVNVELCLVVEGCDLQMLAWLLVLPQRTFFINAGVLFPRSGKNRSSSCIHSVVFSLRVRVQDGSVGTNQWIRQVQADPRLALSVGPA